MPTSSVSGDSMGDSWALRHRRASSSFKVANGAASSVRHFLIGVGITNGII